MEERGRRVGRRRLYPRLLAGAIGVGAVAACLHWLTGVEPETVWKPLAAATALALLSAAAWEVVERRGRVPPGESPPLSAWVAFPLAVVCGLAMTPFLAITLWPDARGWVLGDDIEAVLLRDRERATVEVRFPEPTLARAVNLRLQSRRLPPGGAPVDPSAARWRDPRTLEVDLAAELARLGVDAVESVGINMLAGAPRITYASGMTAPERTIVIR